MPDNNLLVQLDSEQTPNYNSMICLSKEKNLDNLRKVVIKHKIISDDYIKIQKILKIFSLEMIKKNWRVYNIGNNYYNNYIYGMSHHMGTIRMSRNKSKGVVDENLKFNDFENLYICSSACFPTYGHANPSLTIGALACMLAENILK